MIILSENVKKIIKRELKDKFSEFAILAAAEKCDQCWFVQKALLCDRSEAKLTSAKIPKELQWRVLRYCREHNEFPVIAHSHVCYSTLEFSSVDTSFERAMFDAWKDMAVNAELLSILIGKNESVARIWNTSGIWNETVQNFF